MCLGAGAEAANEQALRNYEHQLEKRERNWMQTLSLTKVEQLQYEQGIDASNLGLANVYSDIKEKHGQLVDEMFTQSQEDWKTFLNENTGDQLKAKGRLGRSSQRISAIDLGQYLKKGSDQVNQLTKTADALSKAGAKAAGQTRAQQMQMFSRVAFVKHPDIAPPQPVMQNVGAAAFMDALSIAGTIASIAAIPATGGGSALLTTLFPPPSDRRLKENIQKIGESISGLGIYKFNYIGKAKQYIGAMADEVIKVVPEAAVLRSDGFYGVNYNLIDVTFKEV